MSQCLEMCAFCGIWVKVFIVKTLYYGKAKIKWAFVVSLNELCMGFCSSVTFHDLYQVNPNG